MSWNVVLLKGLVTLNVANLDDEKIWNILGTLTENLDEIQAKEMADAA